jgi:hypothetical protein
MINTAKTVAVLVLLGGFGAYAASDSVPKGMGNKAVRGAVDMVTGIVELPMQTYKGYDKGLGLIKNKPTSKAVGTVLGFFRGISHSVGRIGSGATELFGFWTANPEDNEGVGVPFDAEYAWEMGTQYSYFKPSIKEGVKPVGRKLAHGVTDAFAGILEVPGQIKAGMDDGNVAVGAGKGIWFWWSRTLNGFSNIVLCIVPNHETTEGYAWEGDWAWSALTE